jgi:hypothetical protein
MFTLSSHISRGACSRTLFALPAIALVATLIGIAAPIAGARGKDGSYGWPVKPFSRQHPIRGGFGDPRTIFAAPPTMDGVLHGGGGFSFHFGVDISAPDGTKVYPVLSGTVTRVTHEGVAVDAGGGRCFQYWHIRARVRMGEHVEADKTVLGTILRGAQHVHLTELQDGRPIDPLQRGHLTPYADRTTPEIEAISFRRGDTGENVMPNFVRGRMLLTAEAYDRPALPVPGEWAGMPVAPALVTWQIRGLGGKVVVPKTVAVDFRSTIPSNRAFWSYYARGTYQNNSVFGAHYSYRQPGCFLFKLTPTAFDTRQLKDGVYDLVVTVTDIRGNHSSQSRRFTVHNRPGWIGS